MVSLLVHHIDNAARNDRALTAAALIHGFHGAGRRNSRGFADNPLRQCVPGRP
jgi:hypothetical protein